MSTPVSLSPSPSSVSTAPSSSDVPLTSSSFWLTGVLIIIILFLLLLVAILVVRYLWKRRCLPLYYYGGAEASCAFLAQYLVCLTFDRKPSGHHKICQVCAEVWYEKDEAFIIPLNLTKLVPLKQKLTSQALVRTNRPLSNIRMATLKLKCAPFCKAASKQGSDRLLEQLQILSLSIQKVPSRRMISTLVRASEAQGGSACGRGNFGSKESPMFMEEDRYYMFASETYQSLDYHAISHVVICPFDSWIVFNFTTLCAIFLLVGTLKGLMVAKATLVENFEAIAITGASFSSITLFISAQYLFVAWIQGPYLASFGRSLSGCLLHVGLLTLSVIIGLGAAFGGVTLLQPVDQPITDASNAKKTSSDVNGLYTSFIAATIYLVFETVACFLDAYTGFLGHALWPTGESILVCPEGECKDGSKEELPKSKHPL